MKLSQVLKKILYDYQCNLQYCIDYKSTSEEIKAQLQEDSMDYGICYYSIARYKYILSQDPKWQDLSSKYFKDSLFFTEIPLNLNLKYDLLASLKYRISILKQIIKQL
mgnify:CR=1 FL=1